MSYIILPDGSIEVCSKKFEPINAQFASPPKGQELTAAVKEGREILNGYAGYYSR